MCASPSLRIMLWPISTFISPFGWGEENTSVRFSWVKISSRRVNTVDPSCGTYAIGARLRICARSGYGSAQNAATSMSKCGALDMTSDGPVAAVRHHDRSGDVARQIGGEEKRRSHDVFRLACAAERGVIHEDFHQVRIVGPHRRVQRRLDQPGADGVDPHAVLAEFRRERAGEAEHAMLRGGVGWRIRRSHVHEGLD